MMLNKTEHKMAIIHLHHRMDMVTMYIYIYMHTHACQMVRHVIICMYANKHATTHAHAYMHMVGEAF